MKKIATSWVLPLFVAAGILVAATTPPRTRDADADLEIIRKRIVDDLLSPAVNSLRIKQLVYAVQADGSWPDINYKDVSRTGFEHRIHLENMLELSIAYKKPGSEFYKDDNIRKTIAAVMGFWLQHDFICDNWWWNEMGTPNLMINTLLIMDTDLNEQQRTAGLKIARRANLEASGARPGGDLIVIAGMLGKQALFYNNADTLNRVVKAMGSEIKISIGRGINPDMGFHHRVDNVTSILTYGTNYANAFAYWAAKTAGTQFALPQESMKLLTDYYLDGICASMAFGKYPDPGAKNRDITRRGTLEPAGPGIPQNLLLASSTYRVKELEDVIKVRKGELSYSGSRDRFFWHSEYFTHQRPGYFTSVRMHSSRNNNVEQPHNEEGLKNHYYADGSTFITRTGKEYVDVFPAWDWQKIPGTTVVQQAAVPHWRELAKKGLTDFTGGVTDSIYGAAAFDFASPYAPLKARKSWFFFNNEFICLGAGITSTADDPVATTLNQCLLNGTVTVQSAEGRSTLQKGKHALTKVSWVLHDGIAYLFPTPVDAQVDNTTATGNWRQINHQAWATEDPVQKDLFCLWVNHGARPANATYAYVVIPGAEAITAESYSRRSAISILANTPDVQAVQNTALNISQVVFYTAGQIKLSKALTLSVDQPCMVMVETSGKTVKKITVADPSHKLTTLQLTLTGLKPLRIDLPGEGYAGKSVVIEPGKH